MIAMFVVALLFQQAPPPESAEGYLAQGMRQVEEGDLDTAVLTLDTAIRRLGVQPNREAQLSAAHLHLAMAYLGLGQNEKAAAAVELAWKYGPHQKLDRTRFPPTLIAMYEKVGRESPPLLRSAPATVAAPVPEKKGGSKLPLIVLGAGAAAGGVALAAGGSDDPTPPTTLADPRRTTPFTGTPAQLLPGAAGEGCANRQFVGAFSPAIAVSGAGAIDVTVNFSAPAGGYRMVLCGYRGGATLSALRVTGGTNGCDMAGFPLTECVCAGPGPSVTAATTVDGAMDVQWFLSFSCDGAAPVSALAVPWSGTMRHP